MAASVNYTSHLVTEVQQLLKEVALGKIIQNDKILPKNLQKAGSRINMLLAEMRAEDHSAESFLEIPSGREVRWCAILIIAAYLNPIQIPWDYDRYSEADKAGRADKYFAKVELGYFDTPTTLLDCHGKILVWYLPSLLMPLRVARVNEIMQSLKPLWTGSKYSCKDKNSSREKGFLDISDDSRLGKGRLTISIGTFMNGHKRLADPIVRSGALHATAVQHWLQQIEPVERLLDAVLHIIHPEMWAVNIASTEQLKKLLTKPLSVWPTSYEGMEVIVNRITKTHIDSGGARAFYDHLLSLGLEHDAVLELDDLYASFQYEAGTSVFLTGRTFNHSVPAWTTGERIVLTHYSKDGIQHRLNVARPSLPTQLGWWRKFGSD